MATTAINTSANPLEAAWTWGAGTVVESDEEDHDSQPSHEDESQQVPNATSKVKEDEEDDWNLFEHRKGVEDDAESGTAATFMGDSISCVSSIQELKVAVRDGSLDNALEEARRSFELCQSLRFSQLVSGLPEEDEENDDKKKANDISSSNFISLANIDASDNKPLVGSSWWNLLPSPSEVDESIRSTGSAKRNKKMKDARRAKVLSSISLSLSLVSSPISESSIPEDIASVKSRRTHNQKSKSKSPKRSTSYKKKDKPHDSSSVVSSKSKQKKTRKTKSLSPTRSSGGSRKKIAEKLDAVNKRLGDTVGVVSTPARRRNKNAHKIEGYQQGKH
ncbi:unnamed protein product [Cylindrotheca closterium]|uniref:Uncharacterized protein n=1 Tax=Cylindrotheca closterium TaxID=2856 RepID=A0AAD2CI22_9STRA|nr:unnamed protein product [Cylindrotheca closterium]